MEETFPSQSVHREEIEQRIDTEAASTCNIGTDIICPMIGHGMGI